MYCLGDLFGGNLPLFAVRSCGKRGTCEERSGGRCLCTELQFLPVLMSKLNTPEIDCYNLQFLQ